MRIMLVDDHAAFRQMVKTVLAALAADFVECEDGQEAVAQYSRCRPNVVLMDIAMKGLDGLNATMQIRTSFPDANIFMLTQYDDPDLRQAAQEAGAAGYLLKDDLSQLQRLLEVSEPRPRANSNNT